MSSFSERLKQASDSSNLKAIFWLAFCAGVGCLLVLLYADSYQQDGGIHYLFARWGWHHPDYFVRVWARPLFTFLYSFPAQLGYTSARLLTVLICVMTAWQTWRTAKLLEFPRAELAIPFLFFQPSFFLLSHETMTEPLFALTFITALHLHLSGRIKLGALVASLMILARPEGFFLGALWGVWILFDKRVSDNFIKRILTTLILSSGSILWVVASWLITGDILFIKHNWPSNWEATGGIYGTGTIFTYIINSPEMVGLLFLPAFVFGLVKALKEKSLVTITSPFLLLFVLHTFFFMYGLFGSAGYARYFVCVSPAIALLTLYGWNSLAELLRIENKKIQIAAASIVFLMSLTLCFIYVDGLSWNRDAVAVNDACSHFKQNERPVSYFYYSQSAMAIFMDKDNSQQPHLSEDKARNLEILRDAPKGTLVFWDMETGKAFHNLKANEIIALGYKNLYSQSYVLKGYLPHHLWSNSFGSPRKQEMYLLYKE